VRSASIINPDEGRHFWNVGLLQRDYRVLYTRKLPSSFSTTWEPEISHSDDGFKEQHCTRSPHSIERQCEDDDDSTHTPLSFQSRDRDVLGTGRSCQKWGDSFYWNRKTCIAQPGGDVFIVSGARWVGPWLRNKVTACTKRVGFRDSSRLDKSGMHSYHSLPKCRRCERVELTFTSLYVFMVWIQLRDKSDVACAMLSIHCHIW
jgi:hypothetical protein